MYPPKTLIVFALIPLTLASDCSVSDSTPWPFGDSSSDSSSSSSSGGSSSTDPCAQFDEDTAAYQACAGIALDGQCNSVGGDGCSDSSSSSSGGTGDLISNPGDNLIDSSGSSDSGDGGLISRMQVRATFSCTSSETCYQFANDSLVCYDGATSNYHDDAGGMGNFLEGTYTTSNEDVVAETTSAPSGSARSPTSTAGVSSGAKTGTGTAASTAATPTSGGEMLIADAVAGALGLIAAFIM